MEQKYYGVPKKKQRKATKGLTYEALHTLYD
jgi:hypothetical protein